MPHKPPRNLLRSLPLKLHIIGLRIHTDPLILIPTFLSNLNHPRSQIQICHKIRRPYPIQTQRMPVFHLLLRQRPRLYIRRLQPPLMQPQIPLRKPQIHIRIRKRRPDQIPHERRLVRLHLVVDGRRTQRYQPRDLIRAVGASEVAQRGDDGVGPVLRDPEAGRVFVFAEDAEDHVSGGDAVCEEGDVS